VQEKVPLILSGRAPLTAYGGPWGGLG
jgi:hypothetical protein